MLLSKNMFDGQDDHVNPALLRLDISMNRY
jgi:hypothetical protein